MREPQEPSCALSKQRRNDAVDRRDRGGEKRRLPPGYSLDRSDPEVLVLLCPQGTVIARFSTRGAAAETIEREARTHYKERNRSA